MNLTKTKSWGELSPAQCRIVALLGTIQSLLAIAAWTDLARRPAETVNGSKKKWAAIIFVNFFGPLAYFRRGRIQSK
ncbi:PLD nuclease N-terminal domain-containing protein [Rhodococcus sp. IEGM 1409]|uniref:PLD nuclease N-terminal domain-containing protein n=1 Tax=Rhodococcus sp. IEGM 1409 TaxID=3047082 RepID=UPI0024B7D3CC|nr:PLD nuclease N-terminal domain-containing protein [Rhodococcus sp. IEGM 1409]MDI9898355.1 PLD nuclease N-terminal domain-containing protein [Rhodococcus sp. IEGM 1409]